MKFYKCYLCHSKRTTELTYWMFNVELIHPSVSYFKMINDKGHYESCSFEMDRAKIYI